MKRALALVAITIGMIILATGCTFQVSFYELDYKGENEIEMKKTEA